MFPLGCLRRVVHTRLICSSCLTNNPRLKRHNRPYYRASEPFFMPHTHIYNSRQSWSPYNVTLNLRGWLKLTKYIANTAKGEDIKRVSCSLVGWKRCIHSAWRTDQRKLKPHACHTEGYTQADRGEWRVALLLGRGQNRCGKSQDAQCVLR